ncbi:hypothetical protein ACHQI4_14900 [Raoultella planticola]
MTTRLRGDSETPVADFASLSVQVPFIPPYVRFFPLRMNAIDR